MLSVKITASSDAHASVPAHLAKKHKTLEASTLVCRSAASQMNPIKCQHVLAASPAIVTAWKRWHVQAAGIGCPERDVNYLKWDNLQKKASSSTWCIISVLYKCDLREHFVPKKQCLDTCIPKNKKWGGWFSEVTEHSVHLDLMEPLCALHWGGEHNNHTEWFHTQANKRQAAQKIKKDTENKKERP